MIEEQQNKKVRKMHMNRAHVDIDRLLASQEQLLAYDEDAVGSNK